MAVGMGFWSYREDSVRFRVFRLSANGHNTLLLDGLPHCAMGDVRVVSLATAPSPNKGFRQILFTVPSIPSGVSFDVTFR